MDLLYFLMKRLEFVQKLYDSAVEPFNEIKRKIEDHEEPYIDRRNPEDYDGEPAFLAAWQDADDSAMVIGHWCLCMVQASFQTFLRDCIRPIGALWWNPEAMLEELAKKKGSWFERYRLLFLDIGIDWANGPVPSTDLEQLNLTRNDLMHNIDMLSANVQRVEDHAKKFPSGLFLDEMWIGLDIERIKIDREKLEFAIHLVSEFCTWLDDFRCNYPRKVPTG
jgi:hypothetical protein